MSVIYKDIDRVRDDTDRYLKKIVADKIDQADRLSTSYGELWHSIERLLFAGGKRLRPYMTHLSYSAFGGRDPEPVLRAGAALELLHVSLLVHDDIIDRDTMRYGVKNISGQYLDIYQNTRSQLAEVRHYANSAAIMAGDLLLAEAHSLMAVASRDDKVMDCFSEAVFAVCGGELMDTEAAFVDRPVDSLTIAKYKTASYSFVAPLMIGAYLAGASRNDAKSLRTFAESLGVAYQLKDDLLGTFGDELTTGKTRIGDTREGKQTYLVEQFYNLASEQQRADFMTVFGKSDLPDADYLLAIELLESSGAKQATEAKIDQLEVVIADCLETLSIDREHRLAMSDLVATCLNRDK